VRHHPPPPGFVAELTGEEVARDPGGLRGGAHLLARAEDGTDFHADELIQVNGRGISS
jgi:hypothetical protein